MKNTLPILCLTLVGLTNNRAFGQVSPLPAQFGPHQWTATVKVTGEDGNPIVGANVAFQYTVPTEPNSGDQDYGEVKGITDTNGIFSTTHTDSSLGLGITVIKSGYYATHIGYQFYFDDKRRNPTFTAILKKIGKPIAMDAKPIIVELNIFKKTGPPPIAFTNTAGYDLMTGDWVAPYGKGINADIIFTEEFNKKSKTDYYYKLTVSFPDVGDSIQEFDEPLLIQNAQNGQSDLRSLHEAPADGYHSQLVKESYAHSGQPSRSDYNQNAIYYIRVRTKLDVNGNVASAHYGKIYGDFMQFTYYLNPTPNDRNIEFDPKQNLISGLQPVEQVSQP